MNKRALLLFVVSISLSSCGPKPISVVNTTLPPIIEHPATPSPVVLSDINWQVVTKSSLPTFIDAAQKTQGTDDPVFVVLDVNNYKALLANLADIKRYIEQQKSIIAYYEKATTPPTPPVTPTK